MTLQANYLELLSENKLKSKIWMFLITMLVSVMNINIQANEAKYKTMRVPAEFELQEAIWIQWPSYLEKIF